MQLAQRLQYRWDAAILHTGVNRGGRPSASNNTEGNSPLNDIICCL
jgi:hypothetical protein